MLAVATSTEPLADPVLISDLHLAADHPRTVARFLRFLQDDAPRYRELAILGDLFEFWIGDDAGASAAPVIDALQRYSAAGHRLLLMHGNRDPLLGPQFAAATGGQLLADPIVVDIAGTPTMLAHGDAWCTLDSQYQAFRAMARQPDFQRQFLAKPVADRISFAKAARMRSETDKATKAADIMDITPEIVGAAALRAGVTRIIHGHTHRPGAYVLTADGAVIERWVLPDWEFDADAPRGGYVDFAAGKPRLVLFDD